MRQSIISWGSPRAAQTGPLLALVLLPVPAARQSGFELLASHFLLLITFSLFFMRYVKTKSPLLLLLSPLCSQASGGLPELL